MSKYSSEFKLEAVQYYLDGKGGFLATAKHFGVNHELLRGWVKKYQQHGLEGLLKQKVSSYSGDFKLSVIEYMHSNHLSLAETAFHFRLANHNIVNKWERIYYEEGPQGLYKERRGRNKNMNSKPRKKKLSKEVEEDLIAENQRLRMENAYLKKLQALVQERTKPKQPKK